MRLLICGGPGIGDFVITLPMAVALKEKYKDCRVDYLVSSDSKRFKITEDMLKYQQYFDEVMYYNTKEIIHDIKLVKIIRNRHYDLGFICQYHNSTSSVWPSRIFRIGGCKSIGIKPINKKIHYDYNIQVKAGIHITDYCFSLLQYVGINRKSDVNCVFDISKLRTEVEKVKIGNDDKKMVVICIGAGNVSLKIDGKKLESDNKSWNTEKWIELANLLVENKFRVILLGGNAEKKLIDKVSTNISSEVINLINSISIGESLAVLWKSDIVIGADTGMMHCAAALGKKTISLFGCTNPKEYQPCGNLSESIFLGIDCSPCFGTKDSVLCKNKKCMDGISVDDVYKKTLSKI